MSMRAAIYTRISDDSTGGGRGVGRQEEDCRRLCDREGWPVVDVYSDSDVSAFSGKPRPGYQRLLADMAGGVFDVVVIWDLDRLHRDGLELEQFLKLRETAGVELAPVTGTVDLNTDSGQFLARVLGARSALESSDKRRRSRRMHEQLAAEGKVSGGGHRPFGYEADRVAVRESEAVVIREAAKRVLTGESMRSIARGWNADGVTTTAGNEWTGASLKRVLCSARIAGLREHHGETVGEAVWAGVIDQSTHERLRARLSTNAKRPERRRRYLLTGGLTRCGWCGAPLVARANNNGRPSMVCAAGPGLSGCGRLRVAAEPLEDLISFAVIEALDGPALAEALRREAEDDTEDARLVSQLQELTEDSEAVTRQRFTAPKAERLTHAEYLKVRSEIQTRIDQTKARLSRNNRTRVLASLPTTRQRLEAAWEAGDIDWRRSLISAVVDHIEIGPAVRGRNRFDPDRVNIHWRV